jgi:hypothetical protein
MLPENIVNISKIFFLCFDPNRDIENHYEVYSVGTECNKGKKKGIIVEAEYMFCATHSVKAFTHTILFNSTSISK